MEIHVRGKYLPFLFIDSKIQRQFEGERETEGERVKNSESSFNPLSLSSLSF